MKEYVVIGAAQSIKIPSLFAAITMARVDTGARTSAIWASSIEEINGRLHVVFFDKGNSNYDGKEHVFTEFEMIAVRPSTGEEQERYVIRLMVIIKGRKIRARFTLADRSAQVYPVLIGRNILRGKFIVDVKHRNEGKKQ